MFKSIIKKVLYFTVVSWQLLATGMSRPVG